MHELGIESSSLAITSSSLEESASWDSTIILSSKWIARPCLWRQSGPKITYFCKDFPFFQLRKRYFSGEEPVPSVKTPKYRLAKTNSFPFTMKNSFNALNGAKFQDHDNFMLHVLWKTKVWSLWAAIMENSSSMTGIFWISKRWLGFSSKLTLFCHHALTTFYSGRQEEASCSLVRNMSRRRTLWYVRINYLNCSNITINITRIIKSIWINQFCPIK